MKYNAFEVTVLVNGKPIREYDHEGNTFIEGRKNSEFEIKFRNISNKRIAAVIAVDGLSVIDGKEVSPESQAYIVGPYKTLTIPGWRLNNEQIASFIFQNRKKSYGEQMGKGANTGVIGVLVYDEKPTPKPKPMIKKPEEHHHHHHYHNYPHYPRPNPWWDTPILAASDTVTRGGYNPDLGGTFAATPDIATCDSSVNTFGSMQKRTFSASSPELRVKRTSSEHKTRRISLDNEPAEFAMGTGFGEAKDHTVTTVEFVREETPKAQMVLYYDSRKNLEKRGIEIIKDRWAPDKDMPNPFPGMPQTGCTPPPKWKG